MASASVVGSDEIHEYIMKILDGGFKTEELREMIRKNPELVNAPYQNDESDLYGATPLMTLVFFYDSTRGPTYMGDFEEAVDVLIDAGADLNKSVVVAYFGDEEERDVYKLIEDRFESSPSEAENLKKMLKSAQSGGKRRRAKKSTKRKTGKRKTVKRKTRKHKH